MDLASEETHEITQTGKRLIWMLIKLSSLGNMIFPNLLIPMKHFLSLDTLSSNQSLNEVFRTNPLAVKIKTFRAGHSLITTPPSIPFEQFEEKPVLVIQGEKDRMVPEALSRKNYERIRGEKKYVCIKDCEHVPINPKHMKQYIKAMDSWFRKYI